MQRSQLCQSVLSRAAEEARQSVNELSSRDGTESKYWSVTMPGTPLAACPLGDTYPSAQDPQRVDRIERLTSAVDLRNGERPPLSRSDRPRRERNPVDLSLHNPGDGSMLLRPAEKSVPDGGQPAYVSNEMERVTHETQTCPSDHSDSSLSSTTLGCVTEISSFMGRPDLDRSKRKATKSGQAGLHRGRKLVHGLTGRKLGRRLPCARADERTRRP